MAGRKLEHLSEAIRQKLSTILLREAQDPRFQTVTITGVTLSKDLSFARVGFCCYDTGAEIEPLTVSLNHAAGFFSHLLAKSLDTRKSPKIHFHYDRGFDHAQEMDQLLEKVRAEGE